MCRVLLYYDYTGLYTYIVLYELYKLVYFDQKKKKQASFYSPLLILGSCWWRQDLSACSSVITPPQRKWHFQEKESGRDRREEKSCLFRFKALSLLSLSRKNEFLLNASTVFLHYAGHYCRTSFAIAVQVHTAVCDNTTQICKNAIQ